MKNNMCLLREVAMILNIAPHRVNYALVSGAVPEPAIRLGNRRIFQTEDIERLQKHFQNKKEENGPEGKGT